MRYCELCGATQNLHCHHVFFGTGNRKISEEYNMVAYLCGSCHNQSNNSVHMDRKLDLKLKRKYQRKFEEEYLNYDFIKIFGRNYL